MPSRPMERLELPFGPNKRFLNGGEGLLPRLLERWQFGGILNLVSGQPITFVSTDKILQSVPQHAQPNYNKTVSLVGVFAEEFRQCGV